MNSQPRIFALVTEAFGGRGGIAQYNRDLMSALASSKPGWTIVILPRTAPDPVVIPSGRIEQRQARTGRVAYTMAALRVGLSKPIDIVFCGHLYMAPLAAFVAWFKGAKLVIQTHGIEAWPRPSGLRQYALAAANLVLSVSRYTRSSVLGWATIAPERVVVLPNTVGEDFAPGRSGLQAEWNLEGKRVLLTVGRMDKRERYKGQDRIIAAIPQLVAKGHEVAYVVIGEGDDVKRLQSLAQQTGVADRVRFAGAVGPQALIDAYRMADLFVMPSTGEGFGIAFLEAMATGTPALGLPDAGARDALAEGELGAVSSNGDLAAAIARCLDAPRQDPEALSAAVRARFGYNGFRTRVGAIFETLVQPA